MKEIMKNMDLLKDDLFEAISKVCRDYETKHLPEFKVGQWVMHKERNEIYRIDAINDEFFSGNITGKGWPAKYLRPATPQEIENHLIKVAKEKGFKMGISYIPPSHGSHIKLFPENIDWSYRRHGTDSLDCGLGYGYIYEGGKWAEIIPDKKKLPKTKKEFEGFLLEYNDNGNDFHNFLNDYTD